MLYPGFLVRDSGLMVCENPHDLVCFACTPPKSLDSVEPTFDARSAYEEAQRDLGSHGPLTIGGKPFDARRERRGARRLWRRQQGHAPKMRWTLPLETRRGGQRRRGRGLRSKRQSLTRRSGGGGRARPDRGQRWVLIALLDQCGQYCCMRPILLHAKTVAVSGVHSRPFGQFWVLFVYRLESMI